MQGRLENKLKIEMILADKVSNAPDYMKRYLLSIRTKEATTRLRYLNNVIRFLFHINNNSFPNIDTLKGIDSFTIQNYMSEIQFFKNDNELREMKESTQCIIYSSLSSFFLFLTRSGYISVNPFDNKMIERPRIHETEVVFLTPEEVKKVEYTIMHVGAGSDLSVTKQRKWRHRDLLLFRIPVINGLRVTALAEINIGDVDLEAKKIRVTEKGNITKYVDFDFKTAQYLSLWMTERNKILSGESCDALFISNRKSRMTTSAIERVIGKYTASCIEGKHITPHKLRATCGTNVYQATKDIYLVSKVLGHKNTAPTKRYAAVFDDDITNAVNATANLY